MSDNAWCQDDSFSIEHPYKAAAMIADRRQLALNAAVEIFAGFSWNNPPLNELAAAQQHHFGNPFHMT